MKSTGVTFADLARMSWEEVRSYAEEPGRAGDSAAALDRWTSVATTDRFPISSVFVAKHLLRLGRPEESEKWLSALEIDTTKDRAVLRAAVSALELETDPKRWLSISMRLLKGDRKAGLPEKRRQAAESAIVERLTGRYLVPALTLAIGPVRDLLGLLDPALRHDPEVAARLYVMAALAGVESGGLEEIGQRLPALAHRAVVRPFEKVLKELKDAGAPALTAPPKDYWRSDLVACIAQLAKPVAPPAAEAPPLPAQGSAAAQAPVASPPAAKSARPASKPSSPPGETDPRPVASPARKSTAAPARPGKAAMPAYRPDPLDREEYWLAALMLADRLAQAGSLDLAESRRAADIAQNASEWMLAYIRSSLSGGTEETVDDLLTSQARILDRIGASAEVVRLLSGAGGRSERLEFYRARALSVLSRDELAIWREAAAAFSSPRILTGLSRALSDHLQYADARDLLAAALSDAPVRDRTAIWRALVEQFRLVGDLDSQRAVLFDQSEELDPLVVAEEQIRFLFETGAPEEARALAQSLPEDHSSDGIARLTARYAIVDQSPQEAVQLWAGISSQVDKRGDANALVVAQFAAGRLQDAIVKAQAYADRFPGDSRFPLKAAQGLERLGDFETALHHYGRAVVRQPSNDEAIQGLARSLLYLDRGEPLFRLLDRCDGNTIESTWVHVMRALWVARKGAEADEIRERLEPAYRLAATYRRLWLEGLKEDPAAVWNHGEIRSHPHPQAVTYNSAFTAIFDDIDLAERLLLVGNGPSLATAEKGAAIDSHDFVIRLNDFSTKGFESHVGTRTSLWYSSANRMARPDWDSLNEQQTRILLCQAEMGHYPDLGAFSAARLGRSLSGSEASFLPAHIHHLSTRLTYERPSTGLRFMSLLEFFAQRPYSITGFDFFADDRLHYFEQEDGRLQVGEVHALAYERDVVSQVFVRGGYAQNDLA